MIWYILFSIWFFLPAGIANATPVAATKIPLLKDWRAPLDFGKSFRGKRVFGANKTWRGLATGTLIGALVGVTQSFFLNYNGSHWNAAWLGALMGAGALMGDALESFIKRQRGVPAGHSWFPFDQLDYIIGALLFIYPFARLPLHIMAIILATYFGLHIVTVYVFYLLGIRDRPI
jgi:CDP-2,3-bis-(O-geranylgeranyl)-sn-glycerol synthase